MGYGKLTPDMVQWQKKQRVIAIEKYKKNPTICRYCGSCLLILDNTNIGETRRKLFCNRHCYGKSKIKNQLEIKKVNIKKWRPSGTCITCAKPTSKKYITTCYSCTKLNNSKLILNCTKGELLNKIKNGRWDYYRVTLQKYARKSFADSGKLRQCVVCGYTKTVDIAHIKAVADFSNEDTVSEINNKNNLIALCPNHHWEFDNGYLNKEEVLREVELHD